MHSGQLFEIPPTQVARDRQRGLRKIILNSDRRRVMNVNFITRLSLLSLSSLNMSDKENELVENNHFEEEVSAERNK
jgi:hypothetical protein